MKQLEPAYQPTSVESTIYQRWEQSGYFNPDNLPGKRTKPFSIAMPPPNVTGELHLGHATGLTIQDALTRFYRMRGYRTLYLPGTDHAGISTQVMVERLIAKSGLDRHALGREKFLKQVWAWKNKYGTRITQQVRQLGTSCDWSREHFTMDQTLSAAVQKAFITMYRDGLIYRGNRIVNWDPKSNTALSDLEVKHVETSGKLYFIKYPLYGSTKYLTVATTRPETMLGDTAVAVHPKDPRYRDYIGKTVLLPIMEREIPIITDPRVDKEFGTGAVKITPAHDPLDYQIGRDHKLETINVIGTDGRMTKAAGEYYGKSVQDARHEIIKRLEQEELLEKSIEYIHNQARSERTGAPIEPLISKQWFVKMDKLAAAGLAAVKQGKIEIVPPRFAKVYNHWLENIQDWCISRQLWWGHQIPVWYCGSPDEQPEHTMGFHRQVAPQLKHGKTKTYRLRDHGFRVNDRVYFENSQTKKILGIGTITSVEKTTVAKIDLQDAAHGKTYRNTKEFIAALTSLHPKKKVAPHTPVWIYQYSFVPLEQLKGCGETIVSAEKPKRCPRCKQTAYLKQDEDTLDTWFSSGLWTFSTLGWPRQTKDLKLYHPTTIMETGWDLVFFWVARMIIMSLYLMKQVPFKTVYLHGLVLDANGKKMSKSKGTGIDPIPMTEKYGTDAIRLSLVLGTAPGQDFRLYEEKIAGYRNFVNKLWNVSRFILSQKNTKQPLKPETVADQWIMDRLQMVITSVTADMESLKLSDAGTAVYDFLWHELADWYIEASKDQPNIPILHYALETVLKLAHPFIPFVTEEVWSRWWGTKKEHMLMIQDWPKAQNKFKHPAAEKDFTILRDLIVGIRNVRAEEKIPPAQLLSVTYTGRHTKLVADHHTMITRLARLQSLESGDVTKPTGSIKGLAYQIAQTKDPATIKKEIQAVSQYIQRIEQKLSNQKFVRNAPREVVEAERQKLAEQQEKLKRLTSS